MVLLDTNICIYAIRQRPTAVLRRLRATRRGEVAISAITMAELQFGVAKSARPDANAEALRLFVAPFDVLPFDEAAAAHYGRIRSYLEPRGIGIGTMDLLIAAHAASIPAIVVTNDEAEFRRVPGLEVENWAR